jgi:hypothetical protein
MPGAIQIGPLEYTITEDELERLRSDVQEGMVATYGRIRYGSCQIQIDPDQSIQHKRAGLLHEVLHGCWHQIGGDVPYEEEAIQRLCMPLLDTLRRNPQLVAFLMDDL